MLYKFEKACVTWIWTIFSLIASINCYNHDYIIVLNIYGPWGPGFVKKHIILQYPITLYDEVFLLLKII